MAEMLKSDWDTISETSKWCRKNKRGIVVALPVNIQTHGQKPDGKRSPASWYSYLWPPFKTSNPDCLMAGKDGKGPGGGVCQVSTTLYNALLALPVQITSWSAHRPSGVQYIPRSFDSAVGSTTDMAFRNDLPYPVSIRAVTQGGALTVLILRAAD